jgi:hypothetical protein
MGANCAHALNPAGMVTELGNGWGETREGAVDVRSGGTVPYNL